MKIIIERQALLSGLAAVRNVVERRSTIPILSNILLTAENGKLVIVGTDQDMEATQIIPDIIIHEAGAITVKCDFLYSVTQKLPQGCEISMEIENDELLIDAGRSSFAIPTLPATDFPKMPPPGDGKWGEERSFTMRSEDLSRLLTKVKYAMSTEETRVYLNGIYLHEKDGKLVAVATDGFVAAIYKLDAPEGCGDMPGIIIFRKAVAEMLRLTDQSKGEINVSLDDAKIKLTSDNTILVSRLIDGNFPAYERVIPRGNDLEMTADAKVLASCVDRVMVFASDENRTINLEHSNDGLALSTGERGSARGNEDLMVDYAGDAFASAFNCGQILDTLNQIGGRDVIIKFDGQNPSKTPALWYDPDDDAFLGLCSQIKR